MNLLTPRQFLRIGGVILILYGVLGFLLPDQSLAGGILYWTGAENIVHVVLGLVAIAAAYVLSAQVQKWLTAIVGVVALVFFVIGLVVMANSPLNLPPGNLELLDTIIHLVVGLWALVAAFRPMPAMVVQPQPM
jgi:hypothetical protein